MSTFCLVILSAVALMLQVSSACNGQNDEQTEQLEASRQLQSDEYFANAFGYTPETWDALSYRPSNAYYAQAPDYSSRYQGRTPFSNPQPVNVNPFKKYFSTNSNVEEEKNQEAENRFLLGGFGVNLINTGLFNNRFTPANTWRPFANLATRIPSITVNPNFGNPINTFDACKSPTGDDGICVPGSVCSLFGGRPSGSCILGKVCCINAITTCGGTVTLNNTYWQSPSNPVSAPSTCALTVRMDTKLVEQAIKPICQVRLDFVSFTTAQPTLGTCTDTFMVGGSISSPPIICGDNTGQHMYLDVPSSGITPTDIQLMFNFATGTATRSWNIKIAMLPCGASYLAPADCLQYFSSATGRVRSFNWQDVAVGAIRQLNNQNYNMCFRTELISGSRATRMCASTCTGLLNGGDSFSITSGLAAPAATTGIATAAEITAANAAALLSAVGATNAAGAQAICLYDFLQIAGARETATGFAADRYCGGALNPNPAGGVAAGTGGSAASVQVCTPIKPFRMTYQTDGSELAVAAGAAGTGIIAALADIYTGVTGVNGNTGFCLDYQEL